MSNEQKAAGEANRDEPGNGPSKRPAESQAPADAFSSSASAQPSVEKTAAAGATEDDAPREEAAAAQARFDALSIENETLKAQIADLTGRLLRAHADMDNLRKRGDREKQETAKYAITKFARDTVEVADNFARAIAAAPAEVAEQNEHFKALLEGVSMTERAFVGVLERHGVKQITPIGEPFNPQLHQAVMQREDASVVSGTVLEVFQAGYVMEDRCLRPAVVVVSTGGAKAKPQPGEKPAAEETGNGKDANSDPDRSGETPPGEEGNGGGI